MSTTINRIKIRLEFTCYFLHSIRIRGPWSLSPLTWIWLYLRGFLPNKIEMYNFRDHDWRLYINDRQLFLTEFIDGIYGAVIDDKYLSSLLLKPIARIPETIAFIKDGRVSTSQPADQPGLASLVRDNGKVILKPTDGNCGIGIAVFEFREGAFLKNGQPVDQSDLEKALPNNGCFILSEYVQQSKFASSLYHETVTVEIAIGVSIHPRQVCHAEMNVSRSP